MTRLNKLLKMFYITLRKSTRKIIIVVGPILSILFTIILYDYSITNLSEQVINDFRAQNAAELANGDIFGLTSRLSNLAFSEHIICAKAYINSELFFDRKKNTSCNQTFIHRKIESPASKTNIKIFLLITLPLRWQIAFLIFLALQLLNLGTIVYLVTRSYINQIKMAEIFSSVAQQAAHDIRSPLSAINMTMNSLNNISSDQIGIMKAASKRVNEVAEELLKNTVSSTEISASNVFFKSSRKRKASCEIHTLIEEIFAEKKASWKDKLYVTFKLEEQKSENLYVNFDSADLKRILSNLLNNSLEALDKEAGEITIGTRNLASQAMIYILDNGKGMSEVTVNQLGEKGFTSGKHELSQAGSGLGFYYAKELILRSNGRIDVKSKINEGTLIEIFLNKVQ